jgi:predicted O-methyltransferase YrrM
LILHRITSYLRYFFKATNAHGVHSPFVYELYTTLINTKKHFYAFDDIDAYRKHLSTNSRSIDLIDLGTGHKEPQKVVVKNIYKSSCHSRKDTELLFKLVERFQPNYLIELGTCLGVSSLYLAKPRSTATLYTFEGNPEYAKIASDAFFNSNIKAKNIRLIEGDIHKTLSETLAQIPTLDFAYLDAHHDYEPTLKFFKACLAKSHENTVIVLDDIHWSPAMEKAWEYIKAMDEVRQTIDLYQFGLVFLKTTQVKEHFVLRY